MKYSLSILAAAALAQSGDSLWVERLGFWARGQLQALDQRLRDVDQTLSTLPEMMQINSCLRVGFKTGYTTDEDVRWVDVTLKEAELVNTIVVLPPLAKAATAVVPGYGFPVRFLVQVFDENDTPHTVSDQTAQDFVNPGCFPVVVRFAPHRVKRVRFTATDPWSSDGPDVLSLAEMMVLSGNRNVATDAKVTSSSSRNAPRAWTRANLVDMITPIGLPVAPRSGGTLGFHSAVTTQPDETKSITLTLPEIVPLDEVRLVPVRRKEVPLWFDYGFPTLYKVECATRADFGDATLLAEVTDKLQPTPGMNLVSIAAHGVPARFIRFTATRLWQDHDECLLALAELQAYANGENVAPHGTMSATDTLHGDPRWSVAALTDGLTENGRLIELPEWFAKLEQRKDLQQERSQLTGQRAALIEQTQHTLVLGSVGSVGGITLLSGLLLWRQHHSRKRDAQRMQEKLARDLHDEIGSNLGSITLICSMASQPDATRESMQADIADIGRVAAESADSMRDMVQLISPRPSDDGKNWLHVLRNLTERLLRGHKLDCQLPDAPLAFEPDLETRRELYLFCKEVLHNIARHAQASAVRFHLLPTAEGLHVQIADDGIGFDTNRSFSGHGLSNLRERAASMNAQLHLHSQPSEGTVVQLHLTRTHRWRPR